MRTLSAHLRLRNAQFWMTTAYGAIRHLLAPGHKPTLHQIGRCYDYMSGMFELLCNGNLHAGYWESPEDRTPFGEAQERLTEWLIAHTHASVPSRVLDVGCGCGTPTLALARKTGCAVVGVTLSKEQARVANQRAVAASLDKRVFFLRTNAMALPFKKESFDAAWALESIFHMERFRALSEMARMLRPGGRVLITDLVEKQALTNKERAVIFSLSHCQTIGRLEHYPELLQRTGFRVVDVVDISSNVDRSFTEIANLVEQQRESVSGVYGHLVVEFMLRIFPQVIAIYEQKMGYALAIGEKMAA